jgi:hypothetical protein
MSRQDGRELQGSVAYSSKPTTWFARTPTSRCMARRLRPPLQDEPKTLPSQMLDQGAPISTYTVARELGDQLGG